MATDTFAGAGALTAPWTTVTGAFNQTGGACYCNSAGASSYAVNTTDGVVGDQEAEVTMNPSGTGHFIGPAVRGSNAAFTCASVDAGTDGVYISTWAAGTQTVVAGPISAPAAGTVIKLRATGTGAGNQLRLYFNGAEQTGSGSPWTVGTALPNTGYMGLSGYSNGAGTGAADWTGTDLSGDTTAPVLTSPTGVTTGASTATVGATTDEANGTLYAVVTTSVTQPSVAQIKAGQNHTGAAASWAGSQVVSSTGAKTLSATGLAASTTHYAHLVHTDAALNDSNRVTSASFLTNQALAPSSDVSAGSWTPSTGATLFGVVDEYVASDSDYISTLSAGDVCEVALSAGSDPVSSSGHEINYRIRGDGTSGMVVGLYQGASLIASWTHDPVPSSYTTYNQTLTGPQADSITNYGDLRLRFTEV